MHSLVGCIVVVSDTQVENNELINGQFYRKIELKLSPMFKRIFYVKEESENKEWIK